MDISPKSGESPWPLSADSITIYDYIHTLHNKSVIELVCICVRLSGRAPDEWGASNPGAPSSGRPTKPWSSAGALASGVRKADIDLLDAQDSRTGDACMHARKLPVTRRHYPTREEGS